MRKFVFGNVGFPTTITAPSGNPLNVPFTGELPPFLMSTSWYPAGRVGAERMERVLLPRETFPLAVSHGPAGEGGVLVMKLMKTSNVELLASVTYWTAFGVGDEPVGFSTSTVPELAATFPAVEFSNMTVAVPLTVTGELASNVEL